MKGLSDIHIEKIIELLTNGASLPEDYRLSLIKYLEQAKNSLLFDTKKEYELIYADKEREEDILADTMAVPLQKVKTFRNGEGTVPDSWTNMLVFGDNLQVLKTLLQMKEKGKLKNADGSPGIRLIYIDPPFATKQEFRGSQDQKAYQDKIAGARFLEFLRKRLVFLRELLSEDGSIYVHLDYKKGHYVKSLMDEIFNEPNFRNEIIVKRGQKNVQAQFETMDSLASGHDSLLFYSKQSGIRFSILKASLSEVRPGTWNNHWRGTDRPTMRYKLFDILPNRGQWRWSKERTMKAVDNYEEYVSQYSKKMSIDEYNMHILETTEEELDFVRLSSTKKPEHYVPPTEHRILSDVWMDLVAYEARADYPTQKSEALLNRIICGFSSSGDLVLDCFAGSGTTLAVAEKLGRRWIGVDCGKLAIYTMQKRLLNIADSKSLRGEAEAISKDEIPRYARNDTAKKKYGKQCKPFTLHNAGLYDYKMIKELPWEQYRDFALKLFQCRDEKHEISKIELDGYLGADSVLVFNYQKYKDAMMDRGFIEDLHKYLGDKIGRRFFIIAPAASVQFLEDYIEKGKTKYFILRIPYSIIEEIHNRGFTKIKQPASEMDVNDTVDSVGFDFIQVPTVECKYFLDKSKNPELPTHKAKECVIKIEKFKSKVISRKPLAFANLETLSMVMLDYDFDGEVFDLHEVFYAEDLKKNGYEVRFAEDKVKGQMMVIYIDIFGNEKREVKSLKDFKK